MSTQPIKPHWLVRCSCGWTTTLSAEWAAQFAAKIRASLGWTAKEHAVSVVEPADGGSSQAQDQPSLWDQDGERWDTGTLPIGPSVPHGSVLPSPSMELGDVLVLLFLAVLALWWFGRSVSQTVGMPLWEAPARGVPVLAES